MDEPRRGWDEESDVVVEWPTAQVHERPDGVEVAWVDWEAEGGNSRDGRAVHRVTVYEDCAEAARGVNR